MHTMNKLIGFAVLVGSLLLGWAWMQYNNFRESTLECNREQAIESGRSEFSGSVFQAVKNLVGTGQGLDHRPLFRFAFNCAEKIQKQPSYRHHGRRQLVRADIIVRD